MDADLLQYRHRRATKGVEVWLVNITESGGDSPVLCVTNNPGDITYDGNTYTAYNLRVEPPAASADGLPLGKFIISNVTLGLQSALQAADYYRGGTLQIIAFNTALPAADYTDFTKDMTIVNHETTVQDIAFVLSVPLDLIDEVPGDEYGPFNCRHEFGGARCGYSADTIDDVTLPSGNPVNVEIEGHPYVTGDLVDLFDMVGISPSLTAEWTVTKVDADNFTLDGTDGDDYTGAFTSGNAAFAYCPQTLTACRARGQSASFGAYPCLRLDSRRVGI